MGAGAVVAESFARIFYRNGINLGLPLVVCPGVQELFSDGDEAALDLEQGILTNVTIGESLPCDRFSDKTMEILTAGGIKPLMKKSTAKLSTYPRQFGIVTIEADTAQS